MVRSLSKAKVVPSYPRWYDFSYRVLLLRILPTHLTHHHGKILSIYRYHPHIAQFYYCRVIRPIYPFIG